MTTQDTTYNGWTNRSTWNVQLWITNDYGTYRSIMAIYQRSANAGDFADCIEHYLTNIIWDKGVTPDGDRLNVVIWPEIADMWYEANS